MTPTGPPAGQPAQPAGTAPSAVWAAIAGRRAIRRFADRPLEPDHLERILQAGRRSASAKNEQRWDFIVCRDRDHLAELSRLGPWTDHVAGAAVAIALVTPDPGAPDAPLSIIFDVGQAAGNMQLAAWELGIGSCPATVYQHDLARRLLGYPADRHCEYLLSFGYPADPARLTDPPKRGGRRPLADIVHEERW
ncbi:MAG TPA: nitroreductase family protein [Candidatus Limnocylindria bacterium]|nr:nitroreductase family protein [Candidatus Limnocylindria bacterium]